MFLVRRFLLVANFFLRSDEVNSWTSTSRLPNCHRLMCCHLAKEKKIEIAKFAKAKIDTLWLCLCSFNFKTIFVTFEYVIIGFQ